MQTIGLKDWYYKIEDKWFGAIDSLSRKGIPSYKFIDPLEKRGIPSLPVYVALLIIILYIAFPYLPGITVDPTVDEYTEVPVQILDKNQHATAIEGAMVTLEIAGEIETQLTTDGEGLAYPEMKRGETYTIRAEKDGCGDTSKTYTPPIEEEPEERKLTLACEAITDPNEVIVYFNPEDVGHVEYHEYKDGTLEETNLECGDSTGGCKATITPEEEYEYEFETENYKSERRYSGDQLQELHEAELPISMEPKYDPTAEGSVEVTAEDKDTGEPVPGVSIQLICPETGAPYREGTTESTTGMKGKVLFENLEIGTEFKVKVLAGPSSKHWESNETYEVTEYTTVTVETETEFETIIEVTELTGAPIEGATVKVLDDGDEISTTWTDGDGKTTLQLGDKTYRAVISKPGYKEEIIEAFTGGEEHTAALEKVSEEDTTDLNVFISSDPELTEPGNRTIKPSRGEARVTLMKDSETPVSRPKETGTGGGVLFEDKTEGNYCLKVEWKGEIYRCPSETEFEVHPPVDEPLQEIEDNVWDFYIEPPRHSLTVNVTDEVGEPLPESQVKVEWGTGNKSYEKTEETDATGTAELDIIAGDEVTVSANREIEGMPIRRSRKVRMDHEKTIQFMLRLTPPETSQVTVKTIDEEGRRLEEVPIHLVDPEDPEITIQDTYREEYAQGETDEDGLISFENMRVEDEFRIKAEASHKNLHVISEDTYEVKETNKEIEFTVEQGVETTITVINEYGEELENAVIMVDGGETAENVSTDGDGKATIQLEREEEHEVTASKPYYHHETETVTGGINKTIELEEIPEEEAAEEEILIYTDPDHTPGSRSKELTNAKVTLTKDGEKLRVKETEDVPRIELIGLEEGISHGLDIEWRGQTYSEEFTPENTTTYIYVSPVPVNNLTARVIDENLEPVEQVPVTVTWPSDGEEPEQGDMYERGPKDTREGGVADGDIYGGWTEEFEDILEGDVVKIQANWTEDGVTHTPYTVKEVTSSPEQVEIHKEIGEMDPTIDLFKITKTGQEQSEGFEGLSIAPREYQAHFEIDLELEWEKVTFTLNKSPEIEMNPGSVDENAGWEYTENEEQIRINITKGHEKEGEKGYEFSLPFTIDPELSGETETFDFSSEWEHEEVTFSKADSQEITIAEGEGEFIEDEFYVERAIKSQIDDQWKSPTPIQEIKPEYDVDIKYQIVRIKEEPFEGEVILEISEHGEFDEHTPKILTEETELEYHEGTTIETTTISDVPRAKIDINSTAEPTEGEPLDLGTISYKNTGNISVYLKPQTEIRELKDELILEIKETRDDGTIRNEDLEAIKQTSKSKITGEGLEGCGDGEITFPQNAEIIADEYLKIEFNGNCHLGEPGETIEITVTGGDIEETTNEFEIKENVLFPEKATLKTDEENECPIELSLEEEKPVGSETTQRVIGDTQGEGDLATICGRNIEKSEIVVPYTGEYVNIRIDNVEIETEYDPLIDLIWEEGEDELKFGPYFEEPPSEITSVREKLNITLKAENTEKDSINKIGNLIINADVEYLSLSDVTSQLFYPYPLNEYPEEEGVGSPRCGTKYCNLDQLLEYIIQESEEGPNSFEARLAGDGFIDINEIRESMKKIDATEEWGDWDLQFGDKGPLEDQYIYMDDTEFPRIGINHINLRKGVTEDEETEYYHIEFTQEENWREEEMTQHKYNQPEKMRLHIPHQRKVDQDEQLMIEKTRTPIYIDSTIEEGTDLYEEVKQNLTNTIQEAWNSNVEVEVFGEEDKEKFEAYNHGIRVGLCTATEQPEIDDLEEEERENCRNLYDRTRKLPKSAIFKELTQFGNKINIIGADEDRVREFTDQFKLAFGEGKYSLQVVNPGDPVRGHLVPAPEKITYYVWDDTADTKEEGKEWLEGTDVPGAIEKQEAWVRGTPVQDLEAEREEFLSEHTNVSWIIMRCYEDDLDNCQPDPEPGYDNEVDMETEWGDQSIPIAVRTFRELFESDLKLPEGGIYFTKGFGEAITGVRIVIVSEEESASDVKSLIDAYTEEIKP